MHDYIKNPVWGNNLRKLVAETGLSRRAFALRNGFQSRTFNEWCNGRWPGEQTARKVAQALSVDYPSLVSDQSNRIDDDVLEIAVRAVDEGLKGIGAVSAKKRAKLYSLAYQYYQSYQSPKALQKHVTDLLALRNAE